MPYETRTSAKKSPSKFPEFCPPASGVGTLRSDFPPACFLFLTYRGPGSDGEEVQQSGEDDDAHGDEFIVSRRGGPVGGQGANGPGHDLEGEEGREESALKGAELLSRQRLVRERPVDETVPDGGA